MWEIILKNGATITNVTDLVPWPHGLSVWLHGRRWNNGDEYTEPDFVLNNDVWVAHRTVTNQ